jgi:hypothetical protein
MNRLATHLFTNSHNHYPARAVTVMVSSFMTGLALPMNQKSLQKDIESPGGFLWKFKNHFHHDILPLKIKTYEKGLNLLSDIIKHIVCQEKNSTIYCG